MFYLTGFEENGDFVGGGFKAAPLFAHRIQYDQVQILFHQFFGCMVNFIFRFQCKAGNNLPRFSVCRYFGQDIFCRDKF